MTMQDIDIILKAIEIYQKGIAMSWEDLRDKELQDDFDKEHRPEVYKARKDAIHNSMIDDVLVSLDWVIKHTGIVGDENRNAWSLRMKRQIDFMNRMRK